MLLRLILLSLLLCLSLPLLIAQEESEGTLGIEGQAGRSSAGLLLLWDGDLR